MRTRRHWPWVLAGAALAAVLTTGLALALLGVSPHQAWQQASSRSPGELVRYLKRRLLHHSKLEAVLVPPLNWVQRQVERPVQLAEVPALGLGPRAWVGLAPVGMEDLYVRTVEELRTAVAKAKAGQTILLEAGTYALKQRLQTGQPGTATAPIVIKPAERGTVTLQVFDTMGLRVTQPHWVIEGLNFEGRCTAHDYCEHALHIVGRASHTVVRDNRMVDFNAQLKVNGEGGEFPDHGLVEFNLLSNSTPRQTLRPVVPFDLVGGSGWRVRGNVISNFVKGAGNGVSYGAFMKGGGSSGVFERNLVVCTTSDISQPGTRVGLSFGGGGTGPAYCRDQRCVAEFTGGVAQDNIIAHCNDSGLDVNTSVQTVLRHNTLINTAGIQLRGEPSSAEVSGNLLDGAVRARPGSALDARDNLLADTRDWFRDADRLDLAWIRMSPGAGARNDARNPAR